MQTGSKNSAAIMQDHTPSLAPIITRVKSRFINPVPPSLLRFSWATISSKSSFAPPGNGGENLRKLDGEISSRALPIGSRPQIVWVNE